MTYEFKGKLHFKLHNLEVVSITLEKCFNSISNHSPIYCDDINGKYLYKLMPCIYLKSLVYYI
jgi:hypothetical protein